MQNPFQEISERLSRIESILAQLENHQDSSKNSEEDRFLTLPEAADFLGLAKQSIYGLICRQQIPYMKRQKRVYFSKAELTHWLESGRRLTRDEIATSSRPTLIKKGTK